MRPLTRVPICVYLSYFQSFTHASTHEYKHAVASHHSPDKYSHICPSTHSLTHSLTKAGMLVVELTRSFVSKQCSQNLLSYRAVSQPASQSVDMLPTYVCACRERSNKPTRTRSRSGSVAGLACNA